jgi:hypothetical protein
VPGEAFCDFCGSPLEAPLPDVEESPVEETEAQEVAPEVEAVVAEAAPAPSEAEAPPTCPACGAQISADEAFCADCGASLAQPPIPPEPVPVLAPEVEEAPPEAAPEPVVEEVAPEPVVEEVAPEPVVEEVAPEPVVEEAVPVPAVDEVEPEPAAEAAPPPVEAPSACPACGAEIEAGDAFCSSCGAAIAAAPAPAEELPTPPPPPAGPRLVVAASGAEIPLPTAEQISIGREDPVSGVFPDVDLTPHGGEEGGVSRMHAHLVVEGDSYFLEDLDSTNFTFVNKQKLTPKMRQPLNDGDEIRCGRVALVLRIG